VPIVRYTCTNCGLVTRVEAGDAYVACACRAPFVEEPEEPAEAPPAQDGG
jgi:rubredoxin